MGTINNPFRGINAMSQKELAERLGIQGPTISAVKSADRGLSVDAARRVASVSGEKAATLYLASQTAALKRDIERDRVKLDGVLRRVGMVMKAFNAEFRPGEIDRGDADFREAGATLKAIGGVALDLADDREAATKGAAGEEVPKVAIKRDAHGRAVREPAGKVARDEYGRRS